ncbi:MAG: hypothetical protein NVSMB9_18390 [Isosphaeraceae bacterium]
MNSEPRHLADKSASGPAADATSRRVFVFEPGWTVERKIGSERSFCYMTAPGEDFYHRLLDGEIYLRRAREQICLACAQRRGLLFFEPKGLGTGEFQQVLDVTSDEAGSGLELAPAPGD